MSEKIFSDFALNKKQKIKEVKELNSQKEIICILGSGGVGKSIFTVNLAKSLIYSKKKILIIDFDILNNNLHEILGIKKYSQKIRNKIKNNNLLKEIKIQELIFKINYKIDLISGMNLLFDSKYKISNKKIKNILLKLKEEYDVIIIETSSECFFDYTKEIINNSELNFFILDANLLEIQKAKKLLNMYIEKWKINKEKINIIFNTYNINSTQISILKNTFNEFKILEKIPEKI